MAHSRQSGDSASSGSGSSIGIVITGAEEDANNFWKRMGGKEETFPISTLVRAIGEHQGSHFPAEEEHFLRCVIDPRREDTVNFTKFYDLVRLFGRTVTKALSMLRMICLEEWFVGWLSGELAVEALLGEPPGTFVVRLSQSSSATFVLMTVLSNGDVTSVPVYANREGGLHVRETSPDGERGFESLLDLVQFYQQPYCTIPLSALLLRQPWYFERLTSVSAAAEVLGTVKPGTFVIRPTGEVSSLGCSFVTKGGQVYHHIIECPALDPAIASLLSQEARANVLAITKGWLRSNRSVARYLFNTPGVPFLRLRSLDTPPVTLETVFEGPDHECALRGGGEFKSNYFYGKSTSLYMSTPGGHTLIVDRFQAQTFANCQVVAIADGCGWGLRAEDAAVRALAGFQAYIKFGLQSISTTLEAEQILFKAYMHAHQKILEGRPDPSSAGTTTLLGGIVCELADCDRTDDYGYVFICANLGDCKAFLWSAKANSFVEVTACNRPRMDQRDPGGRLGPYIEDSQPDMRNLEIFCELCHEGDILFLLTDGIHNHLDPRQLGKTPADFGLSGAWDDLRPDLSERLKQTFALELLSQILGRSQQPKTIVDTLINYSTKVTKSIRDFMVQYPTAHAPTDKKAYPGCLDHATAFAFYVGLKPLANTSTPK